MVIFLDLDGVLAKFVEGACKIHGLTNPYREGLGVAQSWDMWKLLGLSEDEFYYPMEDIFWSNLEVDEQAHELVEVCLDAAEKNNVFFLSTPSRNVGSYSGKYQWVSHHFPPLRRNLILSAHKHLLASSDRLLIDDSDKNIERFQAYGGLTFTWPQPWNKNFKNVGKGLDLLKESLPDLMGFSAYSLTG